MSVNLLQQQLQDIYEVDIQHRVSDYLITCPALARDLGGESVSGQKERLLLSQQSNELNLSLFLDDEVVRSVQGNNPLQDMQHFCLALEGVSHFLYLIWNASFDRQITLLELELQAEIDKFVMMVFSSQEQRHRIEPSFFRKLLFENIQLHDELDSTQKERYVEASRLAEKYCWKLESDYLARRSRQQVLSELRQFYRLSQADKLRRINRH